MFTEKLTQEDESLTPKWQPSTELGRGAAREKREVSDICLFKEKQKRQEGVGDTENGWRERTMGTEKSFYHVKTDTYRRGPDGLNLVYFGVCVCAHARVRVFVCV